MDLTTALAQVEASLTHQLGMAGGPDALGVDADALFAAMAPALRQLGMTVAEQAATEVGAQLPDHTVEIVVSEGDPAIRVRPSDAATSTSTFDELDARLTLRLPESLKRLVEEEAGDIGDSVNTWVIRTLSSRAGRSRSQSGRSGSQSGEFHT